MHSVIISDKAYSGLNPVQFGYQSCEKSHFFGPAVRTHWLIHFVVSGFGIFKINGRTYDISPGEMFIIPPYVETYYEADGKNPWHYIWIGFTTNEMLPKKLPHTIRCPEAADIFTKMKECENFSEGRSAYLVARLWDLFALLLGKEKTSNDYVKAALDYIHSEYMNKITVSDIAARLNLDRTYFSAHFKRKTGVSPKQYLLNYRMNLAASLLIDKGIPVSVAAASVGYCEIFTFSKMFKHYFGVSPKEYKNKKNEHQSEL
ncbi:MAG: AraC family transcriptional regulator [Clostridia bacterium]|nr:AraC family transcriptional regulator [Clostridia bacterium]